MTDSPRKRTCLHCQQEFDSTGPGNRVCPTCKNSSIYKKAPRLKHSKLTATNGKRLDTDPNGSSNQ